MERVPGPKRGGPEYVTDWRVVYAVVGVAALMVLGGLAWTFFAPAGATPIAFVHAAAADTSPVASPRGPASATDAVEVAVPWAPLAQVTQRRLDTTGSRQTGETTAKPDSENPAKVETVEAAGETPAHVHFNRRERGPFLSAARSRLARDQGTSFSTTGDARQNR